MTRARNRRGGSNRGQSIIEVALVAPVILILMLGVFDGSFLASDKVLAVSAARHAARLASGLGGTGDGTNTCQGTLAGGTSTDSIDIQIVSGALSVAQNMSFAKVDEVDVYRPDPSTNNGKYVTGNEIDKYMIKTDGSIQSPATWGYVLADRCQGTLGNEASIGVQVLWHFNSPNKVFGSAPMNWTDYAVEKMSLKDPNS